MASNGLEDLLDVAVEVPQKPGVFTIDCGALRTLLLEIIQILHQTGEGGSSTLKASNDKLVQDVDELQFHMKEIEKKHIGKPLVLHCIDRALHRKVIPYGCLKAYAQSLCTGQVLIYTQMDEVESLCATVSKCEHGIAEIQENERIISESINMVAANVDSMQEQIESLESNMANVATFMGPPGAALSELKERMDALETESSFCRKRGPLRHSDFAGVEGICVGCEVSVGNFSFMWNKSTDVVWCIWLASTKTPSRGHKKSIKKKSSIVDDVRMTLNSLTSKLSQHSLVPAPVVEPKEDLAKPFLEFRDGVNALGMDKVAAVEDFLGALKSTPSIQPRTLQELMVISSSPDVEFFPLLVNALNRSSHLTVVTFRDIIEFMLTTPSNASAIAGLFGLVSGQHPRLSLSAFSDILTSVRDTKKVSPSGLTSALTILFKCESLMEFLKQVTQLKSWSWNAMLSIAEELHFSKNSTLLELVVVMEKMSSSDINELMSMLLTIPGYINELILSLPHPPSVSTQRLLEHLICLPDNSPILLAQTVELMVSTPKRKMSLLAMLHSLLDLTTNLENDTRSMDNGFFELVKKLYDSEHVNLDTIREVLHLLKQQDVFPMEAVRALIQFSRDFDNSVDALGDLMRELGGNEQLKGEHITRMLRLLEKAKSASPRLIEQLLQIMTQSGLLKENIFELVMKLFQATKLNCAYNMSEFLSIIHSLDFLTLDDLAHMLEQNQAEARRAYEEAMEKQARRAQELKELQERHLYMSKMDTDDIEEQPSSDMIDEEVSREDTESVQVVEEKPIDEVQEEPMTVSAAMMADQKGELHHAHSQAVADSIQELQQELKELQTSMVTLMEERSRRKDSAKDWKKKKRGLLDKDRKEKTGGKSRGDRQKARLEVYATSPSGSVTPADPDKSATVPSPSSPDAEAEAGADKDYLKCQEDSFEKTSSTELYGDTSSQMFIQVALKETSERLDDLLHRLDEHEEICQQRHQSLEEALGVKAESVELAQFKTAVKKQLHNFIYKHLPQGPAGSKRRLAMSCLSCDSTGLVSSKPVEHSLPLPGAFPTALSQTPQRVYEMDLIRHHARSLLEGSNDRFNPYNIPRPCGGQHTSVDVRQTWTYEIRQKESCVRGDGRRAPRVGNPRATKSKKRGPRETVSSQSHVTDHPPNTHRQ